MLSDPMSVTVAGNAQTMPRTSGSLTPPVPKRVGRSNFRTADGSYSVEISQYEHRDKSRSGEIILRKTRLDVDSNTNYSDYVQSGFGFKFETGAFGLGKVDIPDLRAALDAFVTSGVLTRLMNGEL